MLFNIKWFEIEIFSYNYLYASVEFSLLYSIPLKNSKYLKKKERETFSLNNHFKEILVGLLLGDLHGRQVHKNARFVFKQGELNQEYLYHLYNIFSEYCPSSPKLAISKPDTRTGKKYKSISFWTYALPCINELYDMFYISRKKIVPKNLNKYLTSLSLAYWICDDGSWNKIGKYVTLCTDSYTLEEVEYLITLLNSKFNLNCYKCKSKSNYRIIIPSYSIPLLQSLISQHLPPMMRRKIGL